MSYFNDASSWEKYVLKMSYFIIDNFLFLKYNESVLKMS